MTRSTTFLPFRCHCEYGILCQFHTTDNLLYYCLHLQASKTGWSDGEQFLSATVRICAALAHDHGTSGGLGRGLS